jgi:hypothetical protein
VPTSFEIGIVPVFASVSAFRSSTPVRCANSGPQFSIANPQQVFPLAIVALKAHAFGNPKGRDQTALDLLATLSGMLAIGPVFPARPVEMSRELVMLAGL